MRRMAYVVCCGSGLAYQMIFLGLLGPALWLWVMTSARFPSLSAEFEMFFPSFFWSHCHYSGLHVTGLSFLVFDNLLGRSSSSRATAWFIEFCCFFLFCVIFQGL